MGWFDGLYTNVKENPDVWLRFASMFAPQQYRPYAKGVAGVTTMIKAPDREREWMSSRTKVTDYEAAQKQGKTTPEEKKPTGEDYRRASREAPKGAVESGIDTAVEMGTDLERESALRKMKEKEMLQSTAAAHQMPKLYRPPTKDNSMDVLVKLLTKMMKQGGGYNG